MNLVVTSEQRYDRTPDGSVWTSALFPYSFWTRYLDVFDAVRVVARVRSVDEVPGNYLRADGQDVSFSPVPYYIGPRQYARVFPAVRRAVRASVRRDDAVILRIPSPIGTYLDSVLHRAGHPRGVEVVGDPWEVFAPGAVKHPLRPLLRFVAPRRMARVCRRACAAAYVTEHALQRRYPCPNYRTNYSSVEITQENFASGPRTWPRNGGPFRLVFVGSLAQLYKGPDVLIDALAACAREGTDVQLVMVGDGVHRPEIEARAASLGLEGRVQFAGQLAPREAVEAELDRADLFVLPSRTEGLPRAMIEAMARALPCIGTNVGGIPELIPADAMVPPGDAAALSRLITRCANDPHWLESMSVRNLETSRGYLADTLRARRIAFYGRVSEETADWLRGQQRSTGRRPGRARFLRQGFHRDPVKDDWHAG